MILLLGGTSETASIAEALSLAGYEVLVSMATEIPLDAELPPGVSLRRGRLTEAEMTALINEKRIRAVLDATHPYAEKAREAARRAADSTGIYYTTFIRPEALREEDGAVRVHSHEEAAITAFAHGKPVLLTTGSGNLEPYAREAARAGIALFVRVLPQAYSVEACRNAGIPDDRIITGRGPFSVDENILHIREHKIGTLVTKDSGAAGGVMEKLEAARRENCRVVVIARPARMSMPVAAFDDISPLLEQLKIHVCPDAGKNR
jgi:precorrin-6A/cobalt-precorrin-6A reductase